MLYTNLKVQVKIAIHGSLYKQFAWDIVCMYSSIVIRCVHKRNTQPWWAWQSYPLDGFSQVCTDQHYVQPICPSRQPVHKYNKRITSIQFIFNVYHVRLYSHPACVQLCIHLSKHLYTYLHTLCMHAHAHTKQQVAICHFE